LDEFGKLLGPSITGQIKDAEKTVNGATNQINHAIGGGKSLATNTTHHKVVSHNTTESESAKDRAVPHNKSDVPPKQKSDNYDQYNNKFLDEFGNLLGPSITGQIKDA